MSYQLIENYGIIGNMRTVALVGMNGSMDWYCHPQFDSPSIFGAILDDEKGGGSKFLPTLMACGISSFIGRPRTF
jgi:GH15 family glucan-1,4-alpha-glucosidase